MCVPGSVNVVWVTTAESRGEQERVYSMMIPFRRTTSGGDHDNVMSFTLTATWSDSGIPEGAGNKKVYVNNVTTQNTSVYLSPR